MAFTGNYACNVFKTGLANGTYNFSSTTSQVFKIALYTNSATLDATTTAYTTTGETSGAGYTAGGNNVATNSSGMNGSDFVLVLADPATWTGTGGGFTFRYALLVNKTVNVILGYWDYGSSQAVAAGETVVVDLDQTASVGVFKIT